MPITLTGITGLDNLVIDEREQGSPMVTLAGIGNTSIEGRTALNYPRLTSSPVKPKNLVIECLMTQAKLDLFELYIDAQEDDDRGKIIVQNTEFTITESQLALGNRSQVGPTITTTGINKVHYQFYGVIILPGDYFTPMDIPRYTVSFEIEELWA